jgi:hypothetical protein
VAMGKDEMRALEWARSAAAARGLQDIDIEQGGNELALELALSGDREGRRVSAYQEAARSLLDNPPTPASVGAAIWRDMREQDDERMEAFFGDPRGERSVRIKPMASVKHIPGLTEDRRERVGKGLSPLQRYRTANAELSGTTSYRDWKRALNRLEASGYPWGQHEDDEKMIQQGLGRRTELFGRAYMNRDDSPGRPPYWQAAGSTDP